MNDPNGGGGGAGSGAGQVGAAPGNGLESNASETPAGIRRLSNSEYDVSVRYLLGVDSKAVDSFATDVRNVFFTRSMAASVDETRGDQFSQSADSLAQAAVSQKLKTLLPCQASEGDACAKKFIDSFGLRAFRRPLADEDRDGLFKVYQAARSGGSFNDGITAVISAVLQSPSFLYVVQVGENDGKVLRLDPYETASAISFFVVGGPPDQPLLDAAAADELSTGEQRAAHAKRLYKDDPRARTQVVRFVQEWLGIDNLVSIAPVADGVDFNTLRPQFASESAAYIAQIVFDGDGSFASLLSADFTMANSSLSSFYGVKGATSSDFVKVNLPAGRRGLLTQGAFLSAHAARDNSSPVKRGVSVMRSVLCQDISFPTGEIAKTAMMIPTFDPKKTTRERFAAHSTDPRCAGCHSRIDPLGFAFENFDQVGRYRTTENTKTVDASGTLAGTDVNGPFSNGAEMVALLAQSPDVHRCFARNVFRFGSAIKSNNAEEGFLSLWSKLPSDQQDNVLAVLNAYIASDLFVIRSAQQ